MNTINTIKTRKSPEGFNMENVSCAVENMLLVATELGIESHFISFCGLC